MMKEECGEHGEFESLGMGATVKVCMALLGQSNYRANRVVRSRQAQADADNVYKVLTVRGRTGVVLASCPVYSGASGHIRTALSDSFERTFLQQALPHFPLCLMSMMYYTIL